MNTSGEGSTAGAPPPIPPGTSTGFIALCRKCGRPIDRFWAFCPHCGTNQRGGTAWYYDPVWIAVLGLFVLGPFALPLVWRSSRMNRTVKLIMTAALLVWTWLILYYTYQIVVGVFQTFSQLDEVI